MPRDHNLVAALLYDGFYAFEFQLAAEVFGLDRPELGDDWYRFATCATKTTVKSNVGTVNVDVDYDLGLLNHAGLVIVPGWPRDKDPDPRLCQALRQANGGGCRIASICSGAFLLAHIGLLDGKRATTHWLHEQEFRERFPDVLLDPGVLYIDEGDVLTSAGSAAGLDLLLHIVRQSKGVPAANSVARRLVIPPHRDGGQRQFIETPVSAARTNSLSMLLDKVRNDLSRPWPISEMASHCAMSPRSLSRRFRKATGSSPGRWLMQQRLVFAKSLLEGSDKSLAEIAQLAGFGSLENFQRRFKSQVGTTPAAFRRTFSRPSTKN